MVRAREVEARQRVDRLAGACVVLVHADEAAAMPIDHAVGVAQGACRRGRRRDGARGLAGILAIETLVGPMSKVDGRAVHAILTAALILVDTRAHVVARRHLDQAAVRAASHDRVAAAFTGPAFDPVEVIPDDFELSQADAARGN